MNKLESLSVVELENYIKRNEEALIWYTHTGACGYYARFNIEARLMELRAELSLR